MLDILFVLDVFFVLIELFVGDKLLILDVLFVLVELFVWDVLKWRAFLLCYQSKYCGQITLDEEHLVNRIKECVAVFEKKKDVGKSVHQLGDELSEVLALLEEFTSSSRATS